MTTPRLGFVEWEEGTTQPNTLHNTLALKVDLFLAGGVKSRTTDAQPGSPAAGDCYIMTATPSGATWGGFTEDYIAAYYDGAWTQYAPPGRVLTYVDDENISLQWDGSAWINPFDGAGYATEAYVDAAVVGLYDHKGSYNASTNTPDLDTSPSGILKGDAYTVSVAGTFYAVALEAGDVLIANQDNPTASTHWTIVEHNFTPSDFATAVAATAAVTANTAKVTNATHTGHATGATALTLQKEAITDQGTVVFAPGDLIPFADVSNSNALAKGVASDIGAGKRSFWIPVNLCLDGGSQAPAALANIWTTNNATLPARAFDAASVELVIKTMSIPNGFDTTRGVSFTAYWAPTTTNTGTVRWELRVNDIADGEAEAGHSADGCYCDDAGLGTAALLHISAESSEKFVGSFTKKHLMNLRIQRFASDAADTYTADANLIGIELHYWTDKNTDD